MDPSATVLSSWHNRFFSVLGMLLGVLICGLVVTGTQAWWWRVPAALVGLVLLAWAVRAALIGVTVSGDGLLVRELTRSRRLAWSEISSVTSGSDHRDIHAPVLVLNDLDERGRMRLRLMCLATKRETVVRRWVATMEAALADVKDSAP